MGWWCDMAAYYNEIDPFAAEWLRNLIKSKHIADGEVDTRNISDVSPENLSGFDQCHFFAGIGGWSCALRLAEWPDDRPVWTGSCPCQPFSTAGNQKAQKDERHLWPIWESLIRKCKPPVIFGEQVASAITHGWLDDVYQGLEAQDYAVGSAVLPACSVGAPHRRDRLFFVAYSKGERKRREQCDIHETDGGPQRECLQQLNSASESISCEDVADTNCQRLQSAARTKFRSIQSQVKPSERSQSSGRNAEMRGNWDVEPDVGRMAHGVRNRVGKLRGYGNAIVPQVAAEFIKATA